MKKQGRLLRLLVLLTGLFVVLEVTLLGLFFHLTGLDKPLYNMTSTQLPGLTSQSGIAWLGIYFPVIQFIISQLVIYAIFIYLVWYVASTIAEFFLLQVKYARLLTFLLWLISIVAILLANAYFAQNSIFARMIIDSISRNHPVMLMIKSGVYLTAGLIGISGIIAFAALITDVLKRRHLAKHACMILAILLLIVANVSFTVTQNASFSAATVQKPNIFIIGIDAVRPDYLTYFNAQGVKTPVIDDFLKSSVVFTDAYTPIARTFPSWVSILTGRYPFHTGAREDNINIHSLKMDSTLAFQLKEAGYNTLYISDDNRFNNINNKTFGFERAVGPSGNISDFIVSAINDFPMSNLLSATRLGQYFLASAYANHGSPNTYNPDAFIQVLDETLKHRENKPLFLAAHFNITAWPFYYFGNFSLGTKMPDQYKQVIRASDEQFSQFMAILQKYGLLDHALFILLSDHGITLGLPGDRTTSANNYQGTATDMKVDMSRYSTINNQFGIDTSAGYGSDVLSIKQNHHLLAIRSYNVKFSVPQHIAGYVSLLDIAPTILDFLKLPSHTQYDGISLMPSINNAAQPVSGERVIFMESCIPNSDIMNGQVVSDMLKKNISIFQVDPVNGLISLLPASLTMLYQKKQRAILSGDWLLAYYPSLEQVRYLQDNNRIKREIERMPSYAVLVNLNSGKWTNDLEDKFAKTAPVDMLKKQLDEFYGNEMNNYRG